MLMFEMERSCRRVGDVEVLKKEREEKGKLRRLPFWDAKKSTLSFLIPHSANIKLQI
jgi:hypothetical protein